MAAICPLVLGLSVAAQTPLVQVPFTAVAAGVPASTYNGASSTACGSSTTGYLDSLGDGCPATQAILTEPTGTAIDSLNNLFIADNDNSRIRVRYAAGANLAAAIIAAYPRLTFTPAVGHIYEFGGGSTLTANGGVYYCTGSSGTVALDSAGDGCPAEYVNLNFPSNVTVDHDGNIFMINGSGAIKVIYVAGTIGATLITGYNTAVTKPQPGYVYSLSAAGDFLSPRDIAIDSNENIYVADQGKQTTTPSGDTTQATTYGNQIKKFSGTGWTTYFSNTLCTGCTQSGVSGDGGPVSQVTTNVPLSLAFDSNNNLYFTDGTASPGNVRVVYNAGTTPSLYVFKYGSGGSITTTLATSPTQGDVYHVAGGQNAGAARATGSLATALTLGAVPYIGLDPAGDLYFLDGYGTYWRVAVNSGIAVALGGQGASTTTGSASSSPAAGVACNGTSGGPLMTDAYADGCPATEIYSLKQSGRLVFDSTGNFYTAEYRTAGATSGIIREFVLANQFASLADGTSETMPLAFTPSNSTNYSTVPTYTGLLTGNATSEFYDAGNDLCSTVTGTATVETCTYNAGFNPALAGARLGALTLTSSGTALVSAYLGGIGLGAQASLDPSTQTTIGTGLSPLGIGIDQNGDIYISDVTTNAVYKSLGGATPTKLATGFNHPAQIAVDGEGRVYVADPGNNRIAVVIGTTVSTYLSTFNSIALNAPSGVATDNAGNIYVSDTGNNRVLQVNSTSGVSSKSFSGLSGPKGIAVDATGDLFVADTGNSRVVELTSAGVQTTITVSPALLTPIAVALDPAEDLYIADSGSQSVLELSPSSSNSTVLLGNTSGLTGLAADTTGDLFVADSNKTGAIELNRTNIAAAFQNTNVNSTTPIVLTLSDTGNQTLIIGSSLAMGSDTTNFALTSSTTNGCTTNQSLATGSRCGISAVFQPKSKVSFTDTVTFPSNAANTIGATLTGNGVQETAETTMLGYTTTTGGLPLNGQSFAVTATITPGTNVGAVTGTVSFSVNGGTPTVVNVSNNAASTSFTLATGSYSIVASYSGDSNYVPGTSMEAIQVVIPAATIMNLAVASSGTPQSNSPFTVTATLSSAAAQGAIAGNVSFSVDGGAGVSEPVSNSAASISLTLPYGSHTIVATYGGSSYYLTVSNTLTVNVVAGGTTSVTLAVTSPTGTITSGQTVVLSGSVTAINPTGTPTGSVVFSVDGVTASTVSPASSLSFSIVPAPGMHTLKLSYSGDTVYAPNSASVTITVAKITPVITLGYAANVASTGNTITLSSTVSSSTSSTIPTGTVTYSAGSLLLGTAPLVGSVSTFTTYTNVLGNYAFTASYNGDANFLNVSTSTTAAPDFVLNAVGAPATTSTTASVPQGGVAIFGLSVNAFYGYTGSLQFSCTGAANIACGAYPSITTISVDTVDPVTIQLFTNVSSTIAQAHTSTETSRTRATAFAFLLVIILPLGRRRRGWQAVALAFLTMAAAVDVSGCGSNTANGPIYATPAGMYAITLSATDGKITHTLPLTLTVVQATPGTRN